MIDLSKMTKQEKVDYIFSGSGSRFEWITNGSLGDIDIFLKGVSQKGNGGNHSVPILISTAIEFVSALNSGITKYNQTNKKRYNAPKNVKKFVSKYFKSPYSDFPYLLWDGARNGLTHTFSTKTIRCQGINIVFIFTFSSSRNKPSFKLKSDFEISINIFNFNSELKEAVERYRLELKNDESMQNNFIDAWSSIENHQKQCDAIQSSEFNLLLSKITL